MGRLLRCGGRRRTNMRPLLQRWLVPQPRLMERSRHAEGGEHLLHECDALGIHEQQLRRRRVVTLHMLRASLAAVARALVPAIGDERREVDIGSSEQAALEEPAPSNVEHCKQRPGGVALLECAPLGQHVLNLV
eukprot:1990792-Prymnesium_polylepis.1